MSLSPRDSSATLPSTAWARNWRGQWSYDDLVDKVEQSRQEFIAKWVDWSGAANAATNPSNIANLPRIVPVDWPGTAAGEADNTLAIGAFWIWAQSFHYLYSYWKLNPSKTGVLGLLVRSVSYAIAYFSPVNMPSNQSAATWGLDSDGGADGRVFASDDAAWSLQWLMEAHDVLATVGDSRADDLMFSLGLAIPRMLLRFADPNTTPVSLGSVSMRGQSVNFQYSPYGVLYATASNPGAVQGQATLYEAGIALAAQYVYDCGVVPGYQLYGQYAAAWFDSVLPNYKMSNSGAYYNDLALNSSYGVPVHTSPYQGFGPPILGICAQSFGGGLKLALVLGARLYRRGGAKAAARLAVIAGAVASLVQPQGSYGQVATQTQGQGGFDSFRDPYTDGYAEPLFCAEVLSLAGVDPAGAYEAAAIATARNIWTYARQADGSMNADWAGPISNPYPDGLASATSTAASYNAGSGLLTLTYAGSIPFTSGAQVVTDCGWSAAKGSFAAQSGTGGSTLVINVGAGLTMPSGTEVGLGLHSYQEAYNATPGEQAGWQQQMVHASTACQLLGVLPLARQAQRM